MAEMAGPQRPRPLQDSVFRVVEEGLDLRAEFQNFWSSKEKAGRLNRRLRQAFEGLVERHGLHKILKVEKQPGSVCLTLANMWRLTRLEGEPRLLLHTFDLARGRWREQDLGSITWRKREHGLKRPDRAESIWPDLEISYRRLEASPGLFKNLMAAWRANVRQALNGVVRPSLAPGEEERFACFIFRRFANLPSKYRSEVIDSALDRHIWSRKFLASLFSLRQPQDIRLYLSELLAAQSAALAGISREAPNVLPLLNFIPPAWWPRRDLLQDQVLKAASPVFKNFSPAGLRWLRRAPSETLVYFHRYFEKNKDEWPVEDQPEMAREVAELMASLPPHATGQPELAKVVIICSWKLLEDIRERGSSCPPVLAKRLLRLLARHITALWATCEQLSGKEVVAGVMEEIQSIRDWFRCEGLKQGLPDKNSTWRSLKRRSDKWHEEVWREEMREELAGKENTAWESLLGETVIGGIKITPLVTGLDLYNEGLAMRHCVTSYVSQCLYEGWRIFSLLEADGTRSTLSLEPQGNGFTIDQHKGPANGPVSPAAAKAAREVCRLYNRKHLEAAEPALTGAAA